MRKQSSRNSDFFVCLFVLFSGPEVAFDRAVVRSRTMQQQQDSASSPSVQPTWQQAELAVQPQALPMQPMQQPTPMGQPIFMPSDHPQADSVFAPAAGSLSSPNSMPPDASMFQLEIPTFDGRPYGRNWCWLAPDSAGVGTLVYDGPSMWRRVWNTILSIFVLLHLRSGPAPAASKVEFETWQSIQSQKVCSVFLSRVDYIGLEYMSLYSARLRSSIPALRPESHVAGILASGRAMFDAILDGWMKFALRLTELMFQNDFGFSGSEKARDARPSDTRCTKPTQQNGLLIRACFLLRVCC